VASLIDLFTGDKSLQKCKPAAIISEALRAATLNLPLNKALGFSYIVVYNNSVKDPVTGAWTKVPTPTFIPGYKGYIQLAMRTGQYKTINADYVYEGELRKINKLSGEIAFDGDKVSDKVVGYFCYFELLNGFSKTLYMSVENMAEYAKRYSPSIKNNKELTVEKLIEKAQSGVTSTTVGWEGNFNDMALKTVIRRLLSKYGYLSVEMVNAISKDEEADNAAAVRNSENDEDLTTVDVEGVDVTTGEVLDHSAPSAQAIPSGTMPAGPAY
jgi:recombination protein RecT